jgi:hypothetical protein
LKSYFCPCCHGVCQKRKRIYNDITKRKRALERKTYLRNHYQKRKFYYKIYDKVRRLEKSCKKIYEEPIPKLVPIQYSPVAHFCIS